MDNNSKKTTNQKKIMAQPVKRCLTIEEFHKELTDPCPRPCIFKLPSDDQVSNWLNEAYLKQNFGNNMVAYSESDTPEFFLMTKHSAWKLLQTRLSHCCTLSKFIDLILGRTCDITNRYFSIQGTTQNIHKANQGVIDTWSKLFDDTKHLFERYIPVPVGSAPSKSSLDLDILKDVGVWVSAGRNQQFTLHWDTNGHHNINFQCQGTKRFLFYSPNDTDFLYPFPGPLWQNCRIANPYLPPQDYLEDYPLFQKARPYVVDVEPNEILFIPARWWHHVTHTSRQELTVNLTAWFQSPFSAQKVTFQSYLVQKPMQAYWYLVKIVIFFIILLGYLLVTYEEEGTQLADTEKKWIRLLEPLPTIISFVKRWTTTTTTRRNNNKDNVVKKQK